MKTNCIYKLSKSVAMDGRSEVMLYITLSRTKKIQIKSGISVKPQFFKGKLNSNGYMVGSIVEPQSKYAVVERNEVRAAIDELKIITDYTLKVCDVMGESITKEELNTYISLIKAENARRMQKYGKRDDIAVSSIDEAYLNVLSQQDNSTINNDFFELAEMYLNKKGFSASREHTFRAFFRTMYRYEKFQQIEDKEYFLNIHTISKDDIEDIHDYLKSEDELAKSEEYKAFFEQVFTEQPSTFKESKRNRFAAKGRGENSVKQFIKHLRSFLKWCKEEGITDNAPFEGVKLEAEVYIKPYYLTREERDIIAEFDLKNKRLETQRDIFIFQCLTACRVGDLQTLTADNIQKKTLVYIPSKTSKERTESQVIVRVPLTEKALKLVEKYKGVDKQGRLFPTTSTPIYNTAIKEIVKLCGIDRKVNKFNARTGKIELRPIYEVASSHMARRTFIGAAYKEVKDPSIVSAMSGHTEGSKAFARYREVDEDILKEVVEKVSKPKEKNVSDLLNNLNEEQKKELLAALLSAGK